MSKSLFNASWYRVAELKLRLRGHAEIHRQRFRGEIWYILQDHQTGRFHRLSPAANLMLSLMDGRHTLDEVWNMIGAHAGDNPPTQDDVIQILAQLHSSDLLQGEIPPDFHELSERSTKQARSDIINRLRNPIALRFPLVDPDNFLNATIGFVRPIFTVYGFLAWLALVVSGITLAVLNWQELTSDSADQLLSASNLLLIVAVYPVVKGLHEAGHAYATKAWGGAVHEVGLMMLVLVPAPYVDATSSIAFREKWRRILVSGAGIMTEFGLAALAMIFWVNAEPGIARAIAFNVMLLGSISTIFFNGNPLLRFDAYYILADIIEIPNLGSRANKYFWYLVQRYLLGIENVEDPAVAKGERGWLLGYAVAAFIYRILLSLAIALLVASQLFFVGALLAAFTLVNTFVTPLFKGAKFLLSAPRLAGQRGRAISIAGGISLAIVTLFLLVPLPYATVSEGIVWMPDRAEVRAGTVGMVAEYLAEPGSHVEEGSALIRLEDPAINSRVELLQAQARELRERYEAIRFTDRVQGEVVQQQLRNVEGILEATLKRQKALVVAAGQAGRFVLPDAANLRGRFARQGDLLGYVMANTTPVLRVVVPQGEVDLVRTRTQGVEVLYASNLTEAFPARVQREVPAAQADLPSLALSTQGGGTVAIDPSSGQNAKALESLFVFDIEPGKNNTPVVLGSRAYVRFDHGTETLASRLIRSTRQLFLSQFNV